MPVFRKWFILTTCLLLVAFGLAATSAKAQAAGSSRQSVTAMPALSAQNAAITISLSSALTQPVEIAVETGDLVTFFNDSAGELQVESLLLSHQAYLPTIAQATMPSPGNQTVPVTQTGSAYWTTYALPPGGEFTRLYDEAGNYPFYLAGHAAPAGTVHVSQAPPVFPPGSVSPPVVPTAVSKLALGYDHTCALTTDGGVKCWGRNQFGQLGNNSSTPSLRPTQVQGLTANVLSVAGGYNHTCVLMSTGSVKCWGANAYGQMGDGWSRDRWLPVDAYNADRTLLSGIVAIAGGANHTCAVTAAGGVKCWGANASGQLGDGNTRDQWVAVSVLKWDGSALAGIQAVAGGGDHSCALAVDGGVLCWGSNQTGQLGDRTHNSRATASPVLNADGSPLTGIQAITAGNGHTCALTTAGGVLCWGTGQWGQLGNGTWNSSNAPVSVTGLTSGVKQIAAAEAHTCAVTTGGAVKCWGANTYGQLGDGTVYRQPTPVDVSGLSSGMDVVATGVGHTCVRAADGSARCWGWNQHGQLGDNTPENRLTPAYVVRVDGMSVASRVICIQTTLQGTRCAAGATVPDMYRDVTAVAYAEEHSCLLTSAGGVRCWGANTHGQLGDGTNKNRATPIDVSGLASGVHAVTAGTNFSCALGDWGNVACWGLGAMGQLGTEGLYVEKWLPAPVLFLGGVVMIDAGYTFACVLLDYGGVKCWGRNAFGELGDGTHSQRWSPTDVSGLTQNVQSIATGYVHACAVTTDGGVKCWGDNENGQLGDGTTTERVTPSPVVNPGGTPLTGIQAVTAGAYHTCALTTAGGVKCWGWNITYELGDGTDTQRNVAVDVVGLSRDVVAIAAEDFYTCAVTNQGAVTCWGNWTRTPVAIPGWVAAN